MQVIKKYGTKEDFNIEKVITAVNKSAVRALCELNDEEIMRVCECVESYVENTQGDTIPVWKLHNIVEASLDSVQPEVAKSYRDYRNYKQDFIGMLDGVYQKSQSIMYIGDKENSNTDSALVSTKRSLIFNELNKSLYQKFFMSTEELQACRDGYIYVHDMSARRDTMNCCLFDVANVLKGGFEMGNLWYNEPKTLNVAFDVIGDIVLSAASQQYGGFTVPSVDEILEPYAELSYDQLFDNYMRLGLSTEQAHYESMKDIQREFEQGFQGWEYKFNTVASSRGDYPFITMTIGLGQSDFAKMAAITMLNVRKEGQGAKDSKKPVLFPKVVFLYDENLHGEGKPCEDVFEAGVSCSSRAMYPDWLSLTGEGYVASMYKKYGKAISPMGCVDGQEVITYKYNGDLYVESFARMWDRITTDHEDVGQRFGDDENRVVYLDEADVRIYDTKEGFVKTTHLIRNIQDNWCDVNIQNGRTVRVTTDHPFETENRGVVYAKDLRTDDIVKLGTNQYSEETNNEYADWAWLLGLILCDGCYQNHSVSVSLAACGEDDVRDAFIDRVGQFFGKTVDVVKQDRGDKGKYQDIRVASHGGEMSLTEIIKFLEDKFGGLQKINRQIPQEVFSYSKKAKTAFLAGMIDADGYINQGNKNCVRPTVQIGSTNKELALQQAALAQSLGMVSRIYKNHYSKVTPEKIRYRVEFTPTPDLIDAMTCEKKKSLFVETGKVQSFDQGKITKVEFIDGLEQYSYDVTTESGHFEVSGIYSHNCRAFLSPWYERGGIDPADENDQPVFVGRWNIGAVSLHLPMIYAKAKQENRTFYEVLDYYLDLIRKLHIRTYDYLGEMRASTNPLAYCEGGFYGGTLQPHDKIKPILKTATASFGVTALEELQQLHNGKSLAEDGDFAMEVMNYINNEITRFKYEDDNLYAIYGTPAESLCGLQVQQFRKKYGIIEGVSDREYVSNSFHCHVTQDITPIEKQDLESRFWDVFNGGKIQYVKYPIDYNLDAIRTLIRRAMSMGLYEGVNLSLAYCNACGHEELSMEVCPKCGSHDLTKIERMNGYLSYSRVRGDTRLNEAKMAEIAERKSM